MEPTTLSRLAEYCGGQLAGKPDLLVQRLCTDSRAVAAGDLFLALRGDRFDGHQYVNEAFSKGALGAVVEPGAYRPDRDRALIWVPNARRALGDIAARYRAGFSIPVVAVAGSNGKTTTKNLIASVLSQRFLTHSSLASYNNEVGVPLTLLGLESKHQAAVLEAGTNHPGELAPLLRMIKPFLGVITNIGREHLEFFGSLEGVAREEGTLAEALPSDGKLFLHGDSPHADRIRARSRAQVIQFGTLDQNDWRVGKTRFESGRLYFEVGCEAKDFSGEYYVNLIGRHQALNALCAIAVGKELGMGRAEIQRGLAECKSAKMRMERKAMGGFEVLDDSYNANAESMYFALDTLRHYPCQGRRMAVLGDMGELGDTASAAHAETGETAAKFEIDQLWVSGQYAGMIAKAARDGGLRDVREFETVEELAAALAANVRSGDVILVKASRSSRLERVVETLRSSVEAGKSPATA